ncbi:MAG: NAD(P)-dependent oxidoreductase [Candidatus Lustribacter sp.]|jgi:2-hydroxy-3-oxopropionate reductase
MDKPVIGFYGTGIMGNPMVKNLLKAGYTVNVWNRTASKLAELIALGAKAPGTARDVAAQSDICIAIFMGPEPLDAVMEGPDGILAGLKPGSIFIDMGTHPPRNAVRLAGIFEQHGVDSLDAPVRGGVWAADDATLLIMCGGKKEAYDRALPAFQAMGNTVVHTGPAGSGQIAKACHQLVVVVTIEAVAEALALAESWGADQERIREVMMAGHSASPVLERQGRQMIDRAFSTGRPIQDYLKDSQSITDALRGTQLRLPLAETVLQRVHDLVDAGKGEMNEASLYLLLGADSGMRSV